MKKDYDNIKPVLQQVTYNKYQWPVGFDSNVNFLQDQQSGFTKYNLIVCGTVRQSKIKVKTCDL